MSSQADEPFGQILVRGREDFTGLSGTEKVAEREWRTAAGEDVEKNNLTEVWKCLVNTDFCEVVFGI